MDARAIGIHQVFAPVADVNVNPDNPVINVRSFGEDPADVSRFVIAAVKGFQEGGVLATLKHFPGHGDTAVDSHRALPVLDGRTRAPRRRGARPVRAGITAGARSVMVAHIALPAVDPTPAPPLREGATDVEYAASAEGGLRGADVAGDAVGAGRDRAPSNQLGFTGLVVTDAMWMNGVAAYYEPGEAAVRAILAGVDMVLMSPDTDAADQGRHRRGEGGADLREERINDAVERILAEKKRLELPAKPGPDLAAVAKIVGSPGHDALEEEIARRSLTLVREKSGALPIRKEGEAPLPRRVRRGDARTAPPRRSRPS